MPTEIAFFIDGVDEDARALRHTRKEGILIDDEPRHILIGLPAEQAIESRISTRDDLNTMVQVHDDL